MMVMFQALLLDVIMKVNGVGDSTGTILLMESLKQWGGLPPQQQSPSLVTIKEENIQLWFHGLLIRDENKPYSLPAPCAMAQGVKVG